MQDGGSGDEQQREGAHAEVLRGETDTRAPRGFVPGSGVAVMVVVAVVVGIGLGWVGSGVFGQDSNPDLRAMCTTLGALDTGVLDRIENGESIELADPNLARLGALHPLATAAASHPDVPDAVAEAGARLTFEQGRTNFERVREQVDALRDYC